MKSVRFFAILLALILSAPALSGCAPGGGEETQAPPMVQAAPTATAPSAAPAEAAETVTDMTGRVIELPEKIERVVALNAADCEILYALGADGLLVGRGEYCDYPAEILEVPSVQSGYETNAEQIIALEPDVIIMSTMNQSEEHVAMLENAGIAVIATDAQDIEGVYTAISLIGQISGRADEADALAENMRGAFAGLADSVPPEGGGSVYFEVSPLEWGLWTAGRGTFMDELAGMLGLTNAFADVEGWAEISQEQVIERDPDYIVTITMYFGEGPAPDEEIMGRTGWQDMKAIKSGKVFLADSDEISRPGPRLVEAASALYGLVYGE